MPSAVFDGGVVFFLKSLHPFFWAFGLGQLWGSLASVNRADACLARNSSRSSSCSLWIPRLLLYSLYLAMYCGMRLDLRLGLPRTRWFDAIGLESSSGYGVWSNCNVSFVRARISSCAMPWDIHDSSSVGSSIVLSGKCSTGSTWTLASFGEEDSRTCSRVGTFSSVFSSDSSDCWQKIAYV